MTDASYEGVSIVGSMIIKLDYLEKLCLRLLNLAVSKKFLEGY